MRPRTPLTRASSPLQTPLQAISSGFCVSAGLGGLDKGRSLRASRGGHHQAMTIGGSIFLIAVGAILRYAVDVTVSGIEIQTIGLILMIAGVVGLVIGLFLLTQTRRDPRAYDDRVVDDRPVVR
jgi:hypothetical protein